MMKVMTIMSGTSSVRFQVWNMPDEIQILNGRIAGVGEQDALVEYDARGVYGEDSMPVEDHADAVRSIVDVLLKEELELVRSVCDIRAIIYLVPHGGTISADAAPLSEEVVRKIEEFMPLSLGENAPVLAAFRAMQQHFPDAVHIGAFDTAFHQTMKPAAFLYGLPYRCYDAMGIRKYGFSGITHREAMDQACALLHTSPQNKRIIICNIGQDTSICAVFNGQCIDVSNGFSRQEGPVMATRCGSCDPAVVSYIIAQTGMTPEELGTLMNRHAGLAGLCGCRRDAGNLEAMKANGDEQAQLAYDMEIYAVQKYIGSYIAAMGGIDMIVFTGVRAVNLPVMREDILSCFGHLSVRIDERVNNDRTLHACVISSANSAVDVAVVPVEAGRVLAWSAYRYACEENP